ncbi:MAG: DNA/RNA nuclease SfsA, partial [Gammaproteobacteria bacterium]|nr:DNA/RNA nuclease SfsA [Gammaproteobacteria bacterium]
MRFDSTLQEARLLKRYKRFLADIELPNGTTTTIHCPNTGSMKNCQESGSRIWYTTSSNAKRKYPMTWQIAEVQSEYKVGINTNLANKLVLKAIELGVISQLQGFSTIRTEVPYGEQNSRIDILLESRPSNAACFVEVKNVSLGVGEGLGLFPDAVTTRGQKHLQELMEMRRTGKRAVLLFCVQHEGIDRVAPADTIDAEYGRLLRQAVSEGVEVLAYGANPNIAASTISLVREILLVL